MVIFSCVIRRCPTIGMRSGMKNGATVIAWVLVKGPITANTLETLLFGSAHGWIKPLTDMSLRTPGKLSVSEQWSNTS